MSRPEHFQLNRRRFLFGVGAALAAAAVAPRSFFAKDQPLILGAGNHRYEWVRGWGKLPAGMEYGATHGAVQVDSKGLVYFNTDTENAIIVFDADGKFIRSM